MRPSNANLIRRADPGQSCQVKCRARVRIGQPWCGTCREYHCRATMVEVQMESVGNVHVVVDAVVCVVDTVVV
jgi:hypothetical protein